MRRPGPRRPALLAETTADSLEEYLEFRHRVRNLYGFDLDWNLMRPLVSGFEEMLARFDADVYGFLSAAGDD